MTSLVTQFCCLLILVVTQEASALCKCDVYHTQEKLCNSTFIALIRVFDNQIRSSGDLIPSLDSRLQGLSKAHLFKMLKGKYEDFREGSSITLLTPSGECGIQPLSGFMLIAGHVMEVGVVVLDACSLRVKSLSSTQMSTIQHNIQTRAYTRGCHECQIRKEYDYSYLKANECRANYEFPVSTSACMRNQQSGKCDWIRRAHRHPGLKNNYFLSRVLPRVLGHEEGEEAKPEAEAVTSQPAVFTARLEPEEDAAAVPVQRDSLPVSAKLPPAEKKKTTGSGTVRSASDRKATEVISIGQRWKRKPEARVATATGSGSVTRAVSHYRVLLHDLKSQLYRIVVNATWPEEQ